MNEKATLQCCLSSAWGGLEIFVFETTLKMHHNGFPVTTVCPAGSALQNKLVEAGLPTIGVHRKYKYFAPNVIRSIRKALKTNRYSSVLVQQTNDLWQVVPALWGMKDLKLVTISHSFLGLSKRDFLHSLLYGRVDHLVALSEIHKRNLMECLPVKESAMAVMPNSVDPEKFNPRKRSEGIRSQFLKAPNEFFIGVVARLEPGKGVFETLAVADKLRSWNIPFQLVIFGDEPVGEPGFRAVMEEEIQRLKLRQNVQLAGYRKDIDSVIASLDVLLHPSPNETFGRVIIEAMASGVAVVATTGGSIPTIITHGVDGLLAKIHSSEEMAEAIRDYYDHPDKRKRIASNGLRRASETYSYEKVDRKLYGLLGLGGQLN